MSNKWRMMLAYGITVLLSPFIWIYFKIKDEWEREDSRSRWI